MEKCVGFNLGTNSIGLTLRNENYSKDIIEQIEYINSIIFQSGVGKKKVENFHLLQNGQKNAQQEDYISRGNIESGQH